MLSGGTGSGADRDDPGDAEGTGGGVPCSRARRIPLLLRPSPAQRAARAERRYRVAAIRPACPAPELGPRARRSPLGGGLPQPGVHAIRSASAVITPLATRAVASRPR